MTWVRMPLEEGSRRRTKTRNHRLREAQRRRQKVRVPARHNRRQSCSTRLECGCQLWPTGLQQYRSTPAAGARLGGDQACPITAIEIGLVQEQTQQLKRDSGFFGGRSGSGKKMESSETLFARRANAPIHTSPLVKCHRNAH